MVHRKGIINNSVMVSNLHNQFFSYYKYSPLPIEDHKFWPITYSGDQVVPQTALNTKNPWLDCIKDIKIKKCNFRLCVFVSPSFDLFRVIGQGQFLSCMVCQLWHPINHRRQRLTTQTRSWTFILKGLNRLSPKCNF